MIKLGHQPVLWHVMRGYAAWGIDDFILCLGRGGDLIKRFFLTYQEALSNDFVLSGRDRQIRLLRTDIERWRITFADTGTQAPVLQRLRAVRPLIGDDEVFCASYGDVLTNAPLDKFLDNFLSRDRLAGALALRPRGGLRFLDIKPDGAVTAVHAIEAADLWMVGGYFFFRRAIFDEMENEASLQDGLLPRLIQQRQLISYPYPGFWSWTDTLRDVQRLEVLEEAGKAPWRGSPQ
ncbi:MAG: glucose-1-phosphate cytidylyltransferase [Gammaproteobacteria bacterium]